MADVGESNLHIAVPLVLAGLLVFARHSIFLIIRDRISLLVSLWIFSSLILLMSVTTGDASSLISQVFQYLLTLGAFVLCLCFWQASSPDIDDALAMAFLALVAALFAGAGIQGFHEYRWVGLIHPNHYARYAYIALVLHSIVTRRVSLPVFLLALTAAYMVSARTIMICIVLFYASYVSLTTNGIPAHFIQQRALLAKIAWSLIAIVVVLFASSLLVDGSNVANRLANDLAVFDADRGVLSGFTGRADSWSTFFDSIPSFVLFGYGFRSSRYEFHSVHSGVLSYFMDFGMIFGGILLIAIIARAAFLIAAGRSLSNSRMLICGLAVATTLIIQCFEPDNFNIGFIGSFFFILILGYTPPAAVTPCDPTKSTASNVRTITRFALQHHGRKVFGK